MRNKERRIYLQIKKNVSFVLGGLGRSVMANKFTDIPTIVKQSVEQGIVSFLDRPFFLFGHSFGSLVAFEAARFLQKNYSIFRFISFGNVTIHKISKMPSTENGAGAKEYRAGKARRKIAQGNRAEDCAGKAQQKIVQKIAQGNRARISRTNVAQENL